VKVPNAVADNRPSPFPLGTYNGEITDVEDRWAGADNTTMFVRVVLANITPADEATGDVGKRTHREDLCFMYDGDSLFDLDEISDGTPFLFQRAAGLLASLATATGHADRGDSAIEFDAESYGGLLREGELVGQEVKFQIRHRNRTNKQSGEKFVEASVGKFAPVG